MVLGAGGTARAVVYGLSERGVKRIHVVNRTLDRAVALREEFGARINPVRWEELGGLLVQRRPAGEHDVARHDRQAAVDRST